MSPASTQRLRLLFEHLSPVVLASSALLATGSPSDAQIAYGLGQARVDGTQQFLVQGAGGSPLPLSTRLLDQVTPPLSGPFVLGGPGQTPSFVGAQVQGFLGSPMQGCAYNVFGKVENTSLTYVLEGSSSAIAFAVRNVSAHVIDLSVTAEPHEGPQSSVTVSSQQDAGRAILFGVPFQLPAPRTVVVRAGVGRLEEPNPIGGGVEGETRLSWSVFADVGADGAFDGPGSKLFGSPAAGGCDEAQSPTGPSTTQAMPAGAYFLRLAWIQGSKVEDTVVCPQGGGTATADADALVTETGCFTLTAL